jgi:hypothetical protein
MIDRVYQTVKMLANTDGRGNVSPQEYNLSLYNVMNEKYEEYPFEANRLANRQNRGLIGNGLENTLDNALERMQHYLKPATLTFASGVFNLPADLRYIDTVLHLNKTEIVLSKNASEFSHIANFVHIQPTLELPIGLRTGNVINVLPATITEDVSMYYLRKPLMPKWTYEVIGGAELFNPSAPDFQDIDMHPSEEDDIISRLLVKFGINLKEPDLQASAANSEAQEFNQQNAN